MSYQQPPTPPKKNKGLVIALIFLCCAVLLLCCAGVVSGALGGKDDKASSTVIVPEATFSSEAPPPTVAKRPAVAAPVVLTAGDYEVAKTTSADELTIAPGTYVIKAEGYHCYWARVKGFSGELTDIIANDNLFDGASARVTVKKSDKGLHLTGNCEARRK